MMTTTEKLKLHEYFKNHGKVEKLVLSDQQFVYISKLISNDVFGEKDETT